MSNTHGNMLFQTTCFYVLTVFFSTFTTVKKHNVVVKTKIKEIMTSCVFTRSCVIMISHNNVFMKMKLYTKPCFSVFCYHICPINKNTCFSQHNSLLEITRFLYGNTRGHLKTRVLIFAIRTNWWKHILCFIKNMCFLTFKTHVFAKTCVFLRQKHVCLVKLKFYNIIFKCFCDFTLFIQTIFCVFGHTGCLYSHHHPSFGGHVLSHKRFLLVETSFPPFF